MRHPNETEAKEIRQAVLYAIHSGCLTLAVVFAVCVCLVAVFVVKVVAR